ncbi:MAG: AGE family epimerase/isomerase, partial [Opitutaceae bacterium]
AFSIYALAEWFLATGDKVALEKAKELFEALERHASEPVHGGYIEALSATWSQLEDMRLSDKDLNSPKSMNTVLHVMEAYTTLLQAWPDARVRKSLHDLLVVILDHVVTDKPYTRCALFFSMDWSSLNDMISYGHDIEASWLLWEAAAALGEPELMQRTRRIALEIADGVLANGIDSDGSVFYDGNASGVLNSDKNWWPQAEAVVGFLNAHSLSGESYHLAAATHAWRFIENHVIDRKYGEWFATLDRAGNPRPDYPENPDSCKIGPWKCPYHNARACIEILKRVPVDV